MHAHNFQMAKKKKGYFFRVQRHGVKIYTHPYFQWKFLYNSFREGKFLELFFKHETTLGILINFPFVTAFVVMRNSYLMNPLLLKSA